MVFKSKSPTFEQPRRWSKILYAGPLTFHKTGFAWIKGNSNCSSVSLKKKKEIFITPDEQHGLRASSGLRRFTAGPESLPSAYRGDVEDITKSQPTQVGHLTSTRDWNSPDISEKTHHWTCPQEVQNFLHSLRRKLVYTPSTHLSCSRVQDPWHLSLGDCCLPQR